MSRSASSACDAPRVPAPTALLAAVLVAAAALSPGGAAGQSASEDDGAVGRSGVTVDARIEYYDVEAEDLRAVVEILNGMRLEGPEGPPAQGLTRYWIEPDWTTAAAGGECRVDRVDVSVDIVMTLPRWPVVAGRPVEERESWQRIATAIREHEYAHRDLTIEAAGELRDDMAGLRARGCRALRDVVASTLSIADGRLEEAHAELDRSTPTRLSIGRGR